jgi:hypothetical protein
MIKSLTASTSPARNRMINQAFSDLYLQPYYGFHYDEVINPAIPSGEVFLNSEDFKWYSLVATTMARVPITKKGFAKNR